MRFRGPNGQGISDAKTIPVKWTEKDYNWKVKLPAGGHGSPVLWGDKVFVTCEDPETTGGILLGLSVTDGQVLWQKKYKLTQYRFHNDNSYATSTPVVDGERVPGATCARAGVRTLKPLASMMVCAWTAMLEQSTP